jgi:flagellar biosynthetic protein FliR
MPPVFSVTSDQLNLWMVAFLWPFVRMLSLHHHRAHLQRSRRSAQDKSRPGHAARHRRRAHAGRACPTCPWSSAAGFWILIQQILIGAAMGFSMRLVFAAVQAAGEYAGLQMGLSFASFFDPTSGGNTMVIARLLNTMAMLIFLAVDGHLMLVMTLVDSFHVLPISDAPLAAGGWFLLANAGGEIFASGLMLALPLIATLLTLNLAMGILNRVSPQFSIFAVGFPITLLAGIAMLQLLMQYLGPFLEPRFAASFTGTLGFLQGLRQ